MMLVHIYITYDIKFFFKRNTISLEKYDFFFKILHIYQALAVNGLYWILLYFYAVNLSKSISIAYLADENNYVLFYIFPFNSRNNDVVFFLYIFFPPHLGTFPSWLFKSRILACCSIGNAAICTSDNCKTCLIKSAFSGSAAANWGGTPRDGKSSPT